MFRIINWLLNSYEIGRITEAELGIYLQRYVELDPRTYR